MTKATTSKNLNTANKRNAAIQLTLPSYTFTFLATFAGVVAGVLMSIGIMGTAFRQQVVSAAADLQKQAVAYRPASNSRAYVCSESANASSGSGGGTVLGATNEAKSPGKPSAPTSTSKTVFIHKLVSGITANTTATNSMTGPNSSNTITTTNTNSTTVTNNNSVTLTNNNSQTASSGDARAVNNTSSGTVTSGRASNTSNSDYSLTITN